MVIVAYKKHNSLPILQLKAICLLGLHIQWDDGGFITVNHHLKQGEQVLNMLRRISTSSCRLKEMHMLRLCDTLLSPHLWYHLLYTRLIQQKKNSPLCCMKAWSWPWDSPLMPALIACLKWPVITQLSHSTTMSPSTDAVRKSVFCVCMVHLTLCHLGRLKDSAYHFFYTQQFITGKSSNVPRVTGHNKNIKLQWNWSSWQLYMIF